MRMARVNITIPDDLHAAAKQAGLNVSRLAQQAVASELDRRARIAELDAYLAELDAALGPVDEADRAAAQSWADRVLGTDSRRSA
jgi:post-segregation antitoxin (ccd killing protein)